MTAMHSVAKTAKATRETPGGIWRRDAIFVKSVPSLTCVRATSEILSRLPGLLSRRQSVSLRLGSAPYIACTGVRQVRASGPGTLRQTLTELGSADDAGVVEPQLVEDER